MKRKETVTQEIDRVGFKQFEVNGKTLTMYRCDPKLQGNPFGDIEVTFDVYDADGNKLGSGDSTGGAMMAAQMMLHYKETGDLPCKNWERIK
jgi:hypothetical protein